jgi:hypothetical protein
MQTKHLLTMPLVMSLVTVSATARAGSTISDRSYWPSEARQSTPFRSELPPAVDSAFATIGQRQPCSLRSSMVRDRRGPIKAVQRDANVA